MTDDSTAAEDDYLVRVKAQVMTRDDSAGGWMLLAGGGVSVVGLRKLLIAPAKPLDGQLRRHGNDKEAETTINGSDPDEQLRREYLIHGQRISDQSVVLNCVLRPDVQYTKATPTFHHWLTENKRFGLTFASTADARAFDKGVKRAVDDLLDVTRGVSSESDVSDDLAAPEKEKEEEEEEEEEKEGEEKVVENEAEQEDVVSTPTEAVFEGAGCVTDATELGDVGDDEVFMTVDLPMSRRDSATLSGSTASTTTSSPEVTSPVSGERIRASAPATSRSPPVLSPVHSPERAGLSRAHATGRTAALSWHHHSNKQHSPDHFEHPTHVYVQRVQQVSVQQQQPRKQRPHTGSLNGHGITLMPRGAQHGGGGDATDLQPVWTAAKSADLAKVDPAKVENAPVKACSFPSGLQQSHGVKADGGGQHADGSYVEFARQRQEHEYSYPSLETVSVATHRDSISSLKKISREIISSQPPLPTKSKGKKKRRPKHGQGRNPLLPRQRARCVYCQRNFTQEENDLCEDAPDRAQQCIEHVTCMSCAHGLLYHCHGDQDGDYGRVCVCDANDPANCRKWTALTLLAILVPCLCCYPPLTACYRCSKACGCCNGGTHKAV